MLEWAARCWLEADDPETRRLGVAVMLSPTLTVCEAMLRGEKVPLGKLEQEWVRKFGTR